MAKKKEAMVEVEVSGSISFELNGESISVPARIAKRGEKAIRKFIRENLQVAMSSNYKFPLCTPYADVDGIDIEIEEEDDQPLPGRKIGYKRRGVVIGNPSSGEMATLRALGMV